MKKATLKPVVVAVLYAASIRLEPKYPKIYIKIEATTGMIPMSIMGASRPPTNIFFFCLAK